MINRGTKYLIDKYLKVKKQHCAYQTIRQRRYILLMYFNNINLPFNRVKPKHIAKFLLEQSRKYKGSTVNERRGILGGFFRFYYQQGIIKSNPVSLIPTVRSANKIPIYMSYRIAKKAIKYLKYRKWEYSTPEWYKLRVLVGSVLFYGLTCTELSKLKPSNIDLKNHVIQTPECYQRNARILPLIYPINQWFKKLKYIICNDQPFFKAYHKKPAHFNELKLLKIMSAHIDLNINMTILKNTFISMLYKVGINSKDIQVITGRKKYKTISSKEHYYANGNIRI